MPPILDPCCGSRMMWFDKQDQRCLFGDLRTESHYLKDRGNLRHLEIHPDVRLDFTALPFATTPPPPPTCRSCNACCSHFLPIRKAENCGRSGFEN